MKDEWYMTNKIKISKLCFSLSDVLWIVVWWGIYSLNIYKYVVYYVFSCVCFFREVAWIDWSVERVTKTEPKYQTGSRRNGITTQIRTWSKGTG